MKCANCGNSDSRRLNYIFRRPGVGKFRINGLKVIVTL